MDIVNLRSKSTFENLSAVMEQVRIAHTTIPLHYRRHYTIPAAAAPRQTNQTRENWE